MSEMDYPEKIGGTNFIITKTSNLVGGELEPPIEHEDLVREEIEGEPFWFIEIDAIDELLEIKRECKCPVRIVDFDGRRLMIEIEDLKGEDV